MNALPRSVSWYQTNHLAADTNWVRQVLGYSSINLYGVSYGTRLGLTIMKEYPTVVRSAVLDGVVPFQKSIGGDFGEGIHSRLWNRSLSIVKQIRIAKLLFPL